MRSTVAAFPANRPATDHRHPVTIVTMGTALSGRALNHVPVFLVGSPRSGTTWLQCMLAAHPSIASPQEPEFFTGYIRQLHAAWSYEVNAMTDPKTVGRLKGVSSVMTEAEFSEMVRAMIASFHEAVVALKPGANIVLEKCPGYHHPIDVIRTYLPEARFIHLVRDGRDVVSSLVAAAQGWGRTWAPADIGEASSMWVRGVRNAASAAASGQYLEVRYEDLLDDGPAVLEKTLTFCGATTDSDEALALYEAFSFDQLKRDPSRPYTSVVVGGELVARLGESLKFPDGFFREGRRGTWQDSWGPFERSVFNRHAGALLVELGYEPDESWADNAGPDRVRVGWDATRAAVANGAARASRAARAARGELRKR